MSFQVAVDEPNNYLHVAIRGQVTGPEMQQLIDKLEAELPAARHRAGTVNCLADITAMEEADSEARKIGISYIGKLGFDKIAFVGLHSGAGTVAELIVNTTGRGDAVKFFKDIPAAVEWLKETPKS